MPAAISVRVLDSIIRIEFDETLEKAVAEEIADQWSAMTVPDDSAADITVKLSVGSAPAQTEETTIAYVAPSQEEAAQHLVTQLTLTGIEALFGHAVLLHSSAVALEDGRVIGFVGPSGRGKTTVARTLGTGLGYVTDETLAIRADGSVIPYPKPLSLVRGPGPKQAYGPLALGLQPHPEIPLTIGALVLLDRRADPVDARVERVELAEAIGLIAPHTSALGILDRPITELVEVVRRAGGLRRVVYSEAADLGPLLPLIMSHAVTVEDEVEPLRDVAADEPPRGVADAEDSGRYRRSTSQEAVRIGDDIVVFVAPTVFVLTGIGPLLWRGADDVTAEEMTALIVRRLPPPAGVDAADAVRRALDELVDAGLLAVS
jgi:hypothetical protein